MGFFNQVASPKELEAKSQIQYALSVVKPRFPKNEWTGRAITSIIFHLCRTTSKASFQRFKRNFPRGEREERE
jgi:hypothetical protein